MVTNQLAKAIGINATSIHRRFCLEGSYYGIKPTKLPNGRLLWPDDAVEQLISLRQKKSEASHAQA